MFGLLTRNAVMLTDTTSAFDLELAREFMDLIVEMLTKLLGLFKIFPLNVFMIVGFMFLALKIFKSLKGTAKH